jgi:acyl transferase domain-containing protein/NADPH:quinone reductase-like Zn-dependent oxidoreductase
MVGAREAEPVAIIGIGCRFPGGADSPEAYWSLLARGASAITELPRDRFDLAAFFDANPEAPGKIYSKWGGFVDRLDELDADFFGIAPREARHLDPQHRLILEVVWEALQDGGQVLERIAGSRAGVFVGISSHDHADVSASPSNRRLLDTHSVTAAAAFSAANRVSRLLDVRGPSLAVDTACSSSLTALHLARQSLRNGECEMAIVAGANAILTPEAFISLCKARVLSPDGRCRAFGTGANGYVRGEGAGAVILKPLGRAIADGDPIHALLRATAANQDGRTPALGIPSAESQESMFREALREAGLSAHAIQYVEAHGTGTAAGDPIEARAIGRVYGVGRPNDESCLIGSVKTNIGHLEAGAGIAGIIKAALALEHREIPASLNCVEPNPAIAFDELRLRVPTVLEPWPHTETARAAVSSFGIGGANAHAILEEAPVREPVCLRNQAAHLLAISARSSSALKAHASSYAQRLRDGDLSLADVCYTAATRRDHYEHRLAVCGTSAVQIADSLDAFARDEPRVEIASARCRRDAAPRVAFVFTGMGPQRARMGLGLAAEESVFREALAECDAILQPIAGWSLLDELGRPETESRVARADVAHVANLCIQVALVRLWRSWGIEPSVVVGHSSAEMAAAWAAGALDLNDAIFLAFHRGQLQHRLTGTGRMLAAGIDAARADQIVADHNGTISIAAINSRSSVTLAGSSESLEQVARELERDGQFCRLLPVDVPYHGPGMESIRDELLARYATLSPRETTIPMISTATGRRIEGTSLVASHWWRTVRDPVRFADAMDVLLDEDCEIFVEIGPHPVLASAIAEGIQMRGGSGGALPSLRRSMDERECMLRSLGALHVHGRHVRWEAVYPRGTYSRLPTYPWQRERHWLDLTPAPDTYRRSASSTHPLLGARLRAPNATWELEISDRRLSYLEGHRVGSAIVFPGAAYVEMGLAAARELAPNERPHIRDVEFHRMLAIPRLEGTTLQVHRTGADGRLEIHAALDAQTEWTLHASCAIAPNARREPTAIDLASIRERCIESVSSDDFYKSLEARTLDYTGLFRGVRGIWRGDTEALGRISVEAADGEPYVVHPALLDEAFQVLAGALPARHSDAHATILPVSIRDVSVFGKIDSSCWAYSAIRETKNGEIEGDICLLDDAGNVLLSCDGMRFRTVSASGRERTTPDELLYELTWDEVPLDRDVIFDARAVAESVSSRVPALSEPLYASRYYDKGEPLLDRIAEEYAREALRELGHDRSRHEHCEPEELAAQLRIHPRHRRLFERILKLGARAKGDSPTELGAQALSELPDCAAEIKLLLHCGRALAGVVRGDIDSRELLFGEDRGLVTAVYHDAPTIRVYNEMAAEVVGAAITAAATNRPLRLLEVGAGTGALTSSVLRALRSHRFDYRFTDVSASFFARASEQFGDIAGLTFGVLDIEMDPAEQGVEPNSFDLVIASDVLHATRDLRQTLKNTRRLLRPGGLLVFVEFTREPAWADLVFGMLDGWWRFADHDLRPSHALAAADVWSAVLAEEGFDDVSVIRDATNRSMQSVFIARASQPAAQLRQKNWLLIGDDGAVAESICTGLRARGDVCSVIGRSDAERVVEVVTADHCPDSIVFLRGLDAPTPDATTDELMAFENATCGSLLDLVRVLERTQRRPDVWIVTAGAQSVDSFADSANAAQATLIGLGRVLMNEQPSIRTRLVDVSAVPSRREMDALLEEFAGGDIENEIALRGEKRFARRIQRFDSSVATPKRVELRADAGTFVLGQRVPGALDSVELREASTPVPGPGQIALRVLAAGLNFRDVLKALAMPPFSGSRTDADASQQQECTGIVVACGEGVDRFHVGDEVIALACTSIGSHALASQNLAVRKPAALSFEDAATVLVGFVTAHYALHTLARMAPGERVLIHSATGGVGLAAIQLCQRASVEIFATAGSPEKREYLRSLGIEHVYDSRSLDFADEILACTNGEGVDVVLNSLAGEAITRGLEILRARGRFVEIGKRDIYGDSKLGLFPFRKSIAFFGLDMGAPGILDPQLLDLIASQLADGSLKPLPRTVFDVADAEQAFRLMAQAKHIGKVVLSLERPQYDVMQHDRLTFRPDASYLITGGFGGFGIAVAEWMVEQGARHLVLLSRTGAPRSEDAAALAALEGRVHVVRRAADVADESDVARVLAEVRDTMPPLRGVVHAAMVLDDGMLTQIDAERLERVLAPKIAGAWNLHRQTLDQRLDFFVLFSSIASVIGNPVQGNYAAANAFLDALSAFRRSRGLPSLTVSWGALSEVG